MSAENAAQAWTPATKVKKLCKDFGLFTKAKPPSSQLTGKIVNLAQPPMTTVREIVQYEHTTYVEFHRRNNTTRGQGLTTAAFIKNVISFIQLVDKHAAILCYENSRNANSIYHPSHVPMEGDEFQLYFPRVFSNQAKCKLNVV